MMIIIISKLNILNCQLSELDCRNDGSDSRDEFIMFIEQRVEVKKLVEDLQALIAPSMFLDFFVFSILLCALLFEASQVEIQIYMLEVVSIGARTLFHSLISFRLSQQRNGFS